ncbi:glucose-methanol-choline oxidoreductase-like protein [Aspergillus sclerotioniger CBS 115572]|uniref:Glucose-methanol-choline oxidoreductase-like protein n=1 Tax=Aspergillus sclerotioniger CBS 115572 TaxID=1450535 RepID=A0A317V9V4_9EURO|nr:glucose-methanol-choline oxidoreductase-like protein [Aspergillus sclerotioniger CBS 115572]PWY69652.1 glucose-methanol-choline oxidoreductase-like protein [Aspergillus sclerotioniger CBS 115572]
MSVSEADIIIIGGGTAGLALAARLTENPNLQVLVLEAGQDQTDDPRVQTPALWPGLVATDSDWKFMTAPQVALGGKQIPLPQGRILGGSSAMNGMAFIANSKANIDAWGALGNTGWDWDTLSPYYRKTFTLTLPSEDKRQELGLEYVDKSVNGTDGPIQASFPDAVLDPIANAWVESLRGLGYPMSTDPFSGVAYGGYTNAATIDPVKKTRSFSANVYYLPAKDRTNLHVVTGALVQKVLLEVVPDGDAKATGVKYAKDNSVFTVTALREVILCAGAFNSPKLLELSGIGSRTILESFNLPVIIDNPSVGENLQDHVLAGLSFEVEDFINTKDDLMRRVPEVLGAAMESYHARQFGPFTIGGNYSSALLPLPDFSDPTTGSDELATVLATTVPDSSDPFAADLASFVRSLLENPREATGGYFTYPAQSDFKGSGAAMRTIQSKLPENYITICVSLMHPLSRGTCHISSADPADHPIIDPRYLTHPADLEMLARHTRFIDAIAASQPLASKLKPGGKRLGSPDDLRKISLDDVKEYVKCAGKSTFHPTSTCAMMPREKGGVVDSRLRVWGTNGLRIVDASVIPIVPRGNTQSAVYAIAERAADLIKEDLGGK